MDDVGKVLITGGEGDLAEALRMTLEDLGRVVLSPGRDELDVASAASVAGYFSGLDKVDLLICNAGVTDDRLLLKMDESSWDKVIDVNLKGAFLVARAAAKMMMKKRTGHIIFISSHSAYHPPIGQANYAAAKAGLDGLAKSMAAELGSRNVRVNVVVPGFMETKMTEGLSDEVKSLALKKHCLNLFNDTQSVASFICHLDSQMMATSGQIFHLDSRIV